MQIGQLICQKASDIGACMVVMAKHSRGALKELFVGSVTSHCIHHSRVPVLVVSAPPGE